MPILIHQVNEKDSLDNLINFGIFFFTKCAVLL
jgi:hypothetical protein